MTEITSPGGKTMADLNQLSREQLRVMPIRLSTMDIFGRKRVHEGRIEDFKAVESWRPLVTWENKKTREYFFAHSELLKSSSEGTKLLNEMNRV